MVHTNVVRALIIPDVHSSCMGAGVPQASVGLLTTIVASKDTVDAKTICSAMCLPALHLNTWFVACARGQYLPGHARLPYPNRALRGSGTFGSTESEPSEFVRRKRSGLKDSGSGYTAGSCKKDLQHDRFMFRPLIAAQAPRRTTNLLSQSTLRGCGIPCTPYRPLWHAEPLCPISAIALSGRKPWLTNWSDALPTQRLADQSLNERKARPVREMWQPVTANHRVKFGLAFGLRLRMQRQRMNEPKQCR
jgi:hypothetical protein